MERSQFHTHGSATAEEIRQPDRNAARPLHPRPQPSRTDSTDRKRRLTSPAQGRAYPYGGTAEHRYQSISSSSAQRGREDLAARVLPHFRPPQSSPTMSDILRSIPQWQSDSDVKTCPICHSEFTLFFRKHHCRKCGRVVCGDCSRHRITVPSRYIAQPPWATEPAMHFTGVASPVRVCNPCVPDPWSPPENEQPPQVPPPDTRSRSGFNRYSLPPPPLPPTGPSGHIHRHSSDLARPPPYEFRQSSTHTPLQPGQITYRRPLPPATNYSGPPQARDRPSTSPTRVRFVATPSHPVIKPLRREVKEEDECPVCGIELLPGETIREAHIAGCVTTRFGSLDTVRTPPIPSSDDSAGTEASSSHPTASNRIRAQSYRSRGLYQYQATEKDCIDGDGEEQECPICFEEFQPGEALGRLECLCRFHHKCIREWWVRKGPGMCPVHARHE